MCAADGPEDAFALTPDGAPLGAPTAADGPLSATARGAGGLPGAEAESDSAFGALTSGKVAATVFAVAAAVAAVL